MKTAIMGLHRVQGLGEFSIRYHADVAELRGFRVRALAFQWVFTSCSKPCYIVVYRVYRVI